MSNRTRIVTQLAILAVTVGCATGTPAAGSPTAQPTPAATPSPVATPGPSHPFAGDPRWIAYQSNRDGEGVYLIHPDGTGNRRVGADFAGGLQLPTWSPDGTRLAMTTRMGGPAEPIEIYDLATEQFRQAFPCEGACLGDDEPAWSPDGTTIAVIRALGPFVDGSPSDCALWLGDVASGGIRQLTSTPGCMERESAPQWSPDGKQLVYYRGTYDDAGIATSTTLYVLDVESKVETRLTDGDLFAGASTWSPDGAWIVFDTRPLNEFQNGEVSNLYRIHPDGTGMEQLTFNTDPSRRANQPRFSPDGAWLVLTADTGRDRELWIMPANGGDPIVVEREGIHTHAAIQPADPPLAIRG